MSIFMELTACTLFLVRADHQLVGNLEEDDTDTVTVSSVLKDVVKSFFLQRDCLYTVGLFERLFLLNVPLICSMASKLPTYVFDPNVHPFRRSKALEFMLAFWKNNRLLSEASDEHLETLRKMSKRLYKGSVKMMQEPFGQVQPKYMVLLEKAFKYIQTKGWLNNVDWLQHFQALSKFQDSHLKAEIGTDMHVHALRNEDSVEMETRQEETDQPETESEEDINGTAKEDHEDDGEEEEKKRKPEEEETATHKEDKDSSSDNEEPAEKKFKKSDKKRSQEKIKRTQLLKNNSKRLRLESMAAGLEENVFSQYKMLAKMQS